MPFHHQTATNISKKKKPSEASNTFASLARSFEIAGSGSGSAGLRGKDAKHGRLPDLALKMADVTLCTRLQPV